MLRATKFDPQNICFFILGVLLIVPSYLRGLYFDQEALFFCTIIGVLGLFSLLLDPDALKKPLTLVDWGFLGLAVWYLIGIPFSISAAKKTTRFIRYLSHFFWQEVLLGISWPGQVLSNCQLCSCGPLLGFQSYI